jgi:hypothetical protein
VISAKHWVTTCQHDVVGDLHQPGDLDVSDIGDAAAEVPQHRLDRVEHLTRTGDDHGELAGGDHLGVAADRRCQEVGAARVRGGADHFAGSGGDGRRVGDHPRRGLSGQQTTFAEHDLLEVLRGGGHAEDEVPVGQVDGPATRPPGPRRGVVSSCNRLR